MSRRERIEALKDELRARGGTFMIEGLDEEMTESFLEHVLRVENAECKTVREWLAESGYVPRAEIPDERIASALHDLLDHLAFLGIVIESGDHLSDRELYRWITEHLDAPIALLDDTLIHFDVLGSGTEEDNRAWLTWYATDEERARWKAEFPDEELPPRKRPPHDRNAAVRRVVPA